MWYHSSILSRGSVRMMFRLVAVAAVSMLLLGCANQPAATTFNEFDSEADRRTAARFDRLIDVEFDATPLTDAIAEVQRTTDTNVVVQWPALEAAGVEPDMPVRLSLRQVPARVVLQLILDHVAGGGAALEPIEYTSRDGIVRISTARDLQRHTETRVYDVRHLIAAGVTVRPAAEFDLNSALS